MNIHVCTCVCVGTTCMKGLKMTEKGIRSTGIWISGWLWGARAEPRPSARAVSLSSPQCKLGFQHVHAKPHHKSGKKKKTLICKSIRSLQSEHSSGRQGSADKRSSSTSRTWSLAALESAAASAEKTLYWFETLVDVSLSSCRNKTKEQNQYPIILKLVVRDANCN